MIRDYSIDLYVTDTDHRLPESCDELSFIVRASSVQDALSLAFGKMEEQIELRPFRVFEVNVQEIAQTQVGSDDAVRVINGPIRKSLVRKR